MNWDYDTTGLGSRRSKVNTHGLPVDYCIQGSDSMSSFILTYHTRIPGRLDRGLYSWSNHSVLAVFQYRITRSESTAVTCLVE